MPDISVIMAVYHVGDQTQLDAAIGSILRQTFADLELIICSDGANTETLATLNRWRETDERIVITEHIRNLGAGSARNTAAALAHGQFIAIMDADDISAPTRLERQHKFLCLNPQFSFVGTGGTYFYTRPGDRTDKYWFKERPQPKDFLMTLPFVHASILFRRDAFFQLGGYRALRRVTRSEDYDMLMRMYASGLRGANLPEVLYFIRKDAAALRRRKYRYRFCECAVKLEGFARLGLLPRGFFYAVKPLLVGLIPTCILDKMKHRYYANTSDED